MIVSDPPSIGRNQSNLQRVSNRLAKLSAQFERLRLVTKHRANQKIAFLAVKTFKRTSE